MRIYASAAEHPGSPVGETDRSVFAAHQDQLEKRGFEVPGTEDQRVFADSLPNAFES